MRAPRARRTRREVAAEHTEQAAIAAANLIRHHRREARDPDLDFFPPHIVDEEDLAAVVAYLAVHHNVTREVQRAELPHRALLIQYLHQRAVRRYELQVLGILDTGHRVEAQPSVYGPALGLPTRQACWNRRRDLTTKYRRYGQLPVTAREARNAQQLTDWLIGHRTELFALADFLTDHRAVLLAELPDATARTRLGEAIDQAGISMSARPTPGYAAALSYAVFLLRDVAPTDPVLRDGLAEGAQLRDAYEQVRLTSG
jgi:hypothetical protein